MRNPWLNINNARVRGLDYELLWNRDMDLFGNRSEALTLRFLAGRLLEDSTTTPGAAARRSRPASSASPRSGRSATLRYQLGEWGVQPAAALLRRDRDQRRRRSQFIQFEPGLVPGANQLTIDDATVDAKIYTDLTVSYDRELADGHAWQLSLAITNVLDEDPPVIPTFDQRFSSQTNPANAYDVYGRRFLASFSYRL